MVKKKKTAARYAKIGLFIALVAAIATSLLLAAQGLIALKLFSPAKPEWISRAAIISAAVLVLGLALYAILDPASVRRFFAGRQARYGSNTLIMSLAFVGILVVVNVLAYQNPQSLDFTEDKQHTLAPESIRALDALPEKVTAIAFYSSQMPTESARTLLDNYKTNSKGKFDYRFVDPNQDPLLARQYGITGDGKIVLTMGEASEIASYASESELLQALLRLMNPEQRTVYFLTGHGEGDIQGSGETAFSNARQTLEKKNYSVKTLNLAAENKIPEDAKAIVIAGPQHPLLDQEVTLLKEYLGRGGSLIVLENPTPFTDYGANPDPLAEYLKSEWGIGLDNDVVVDTTSNQPLFAISSAFSSTHPITSHMTTLAILPQSRSLSVSEPAPQGITLTKLILTSQQSWGETDFDLLKNNQQVRYDPASDIAGPLTLAAAGENPSTQGRVVVFGNSVFASDSLFDRYANGDIFVNSVDWAVRQTNLVNITPKQPITRTFNPPSQIQFVLILLTSILVIPGLVVGFGISTWLARRKRG